jgi:hypothetical protein
VRRTRLAPLASCLGCVWLIAAGAFAQDLDLDAGDDSDAGVLPDTGELGVTPTFAEPLVTLPPAKAAPQIAPIVNEPPAVLAPEAPIATADRPAVLLKTIVGLLGLMTLAYLGGQPRVLALERKLGISQVITAGFPFVLLGWFARVPAIGLLNDVLLSELSPLLRVGRSRASPGRLGVRSPWASCWARCSCCTCAK